MIAFSALAEPTRFRIVELLAEHGRLAVRELTEEFAVSPPAISQHLKVLRDANLVRVEVNAQQRIYSLNPDGIAEIGHWVQKLERQWQQRLSALETLLKEDER